jgi:SAM-dependent methyltransferase
VADTALAVIRRAATSVRLRAADALDALTGRRDALTPPRRMSGYVGGGDFRATGEEFLGHFRELGGLREGDRVLEMGCGIGRMARVLAPVLRPPGSYDGFDVVAPGIAWCEAHYRDTAAPFRFVHADLRNSAYNPAGTVAADDYRFPYDDAAFNLVIATSLFTHLLPAAAEHYLAEAARVLAPGGRLFCTWLLFSPGRPAPATFAPLSAADPAVVVADPGVPEDAIAYQEGWLAARLSARGLSLRTLAHGTWSGLEGRSLQDIVVAQRD